ncbi:MAG TPA: hypothetical protein DCY14_01950 [Anaerolineae bacterium]|jgi:hypothetical protein|nr:hypothetical protein [Anaerolineae bacterium]HRJ58047.1 hypothetical protein [Anaerolineales bacterium]
MKTLFRILVILVAASIIGGLMYVGVNASGSSDTSTFEEGRRPQFNPDGDDNMFRPEGDERGEHGERGGFGFPGGVIKALVLMSIAGGIYSAVVWTGKKAKRVATS